MQWNSYSWLTRSSNFDAWKNEAPNSFLDYDVSNMPRYFCQHFIVKQANTTTNYMMIYYSLKKSMPGGKQRLCFQVCSVFTSTVPTHALKYFRPNREYDSTKTTKPTYSDVLCITHDCSSVPNQSVPYYTRNIPHALNSEIRLISHLLHPSASRHSQAKLRA